jgi:Lar family restriction alleviation protein
MSPFDPDHFTDMDGNELEDAGEPLACPFCGSGADQLVIERWSAEDDPDTSYHVECLKCGCNGPQAATQLEAAQQWNGRSG